MPQWLGESTRAVDTAQAHQQTALEPAPLPASVQRDAAILQAGRAETPHAPPPPRGQRGRKKQRTSQHLLDRLAQSRVETLALMPDGAVPCEKNVAERALRMMQGKQKVSGGVRTTAGAQAFGRLRSDISTMKKQGHHVIAALQSVFVGAPLEPEVPG